MYLPSYLPSRPSVIGPFLLVITCLACTEKPTAEMETSPADSGARDTTDAHITDTHDEDVDPRDLRSDALADMDARDATTDVPPDAPPDAPQDIPSDVDVPSDVAPDSEEDPKTDVELDAADTSDADLPEDAGVDVPEEDVPDVPEYDGVGFISSQGGWQKVAVGRSCAVALHSDGRMAAWGSCSAPPIVDGVIDVDAEDAYACAVLEDHSVTCWGDQRHFWGLEHTDERIVTVATGAGHACGLRADGTIACWGNGHSPFEEGGDLGITTPPPGQFESISVAYTTTCALNRSREVICWGQQPWIGFSAPPNVASLHCEDILCGVVTEDGTGAVISSSNPPVQNFQIPVRDIVAYNSITVALSRAGQILVVDRLRNNPPFEILSPPSDRFVSLDISGRGWGCAVRADGYIICWGDRPLPPP